MGLILPFDGSSENPSRTKASGGGEIITFNPELISRNSPNCSYFDPTFFQEDLAREMQKAHLGKLTLLSYSPSESVDRILESRPDVNVSTSLKELKELLDNYFLGHLKETAITLEQKQYITIEYLENLLLDFLLLQPRAQKIQSNPYVIHWIQLEDFKMAGDVAMYGYLFFHKFRKNSTSRLSRENYLDLACQCYHSWHFQEKNTYNAGGALADNLGTIAALIEDFPDDLFEAR